MVSRRRQYRPGYRDGGAVPQTAEPAAEVPVAPDPAPQPSALAQRLAELERAESMARPAVKAAPTIDDVLAALPGASEAEKDWLRRTPHAIGKLDRVIS